MRVSSLLCAAAVMACLSCAGSLDSIASAAEQTEPFHKHRDIRHGHDHYYPDRGAIVRDLPVGTIGTSYAGVSYRYYEGIWLEPRGPAYMVVAPPIGLVAPTLPVYSTVVAHGSDSLLYCNDTYYRPRPDLGGYEVVNDPTMEAAAGPAGPESLVGGQMPVALGSAGVAAGGQMPGGTAPVAAAGGPGPAPAGGAGAVPLAAAAAVERGAAAGVGAAPAAGPPAPTASAGTQKLPKVFLYPKNGQSPDQQSRDRYDCYRFAVTQSGFDPIRTSASPPSASSEQQSDFDRAQGACFEGRGYSNR